MTFLIFNLLGEGEEGGGEELGGRVRERGGEGEESEGEEGGGWRRGEVEEEDVCVLIEHNNKH